MKDTTLHRVIARRWRADRDLTRESKLGLIKNLLERYPQDADDFLLEAFDHVGLKGAPLRRSKRQQGKIIKVYGDVAARRCQTMASRRNKADAFDKIVEMLDHHSVDGKMLGDCTRADLLREAVRLDDLAGEATMYASLYRQLASMIGKSTVRTANDRGGIVALLNLTFKEAA